MAIFIAIMSGCGASGETRNNEGVDIIESFRSIKGMEPYLDELGEMDYQGTTEISVQSVQDSNDIYNVFIAPYKRAKGISEWKNGASSVFLSYLPGLIIKATVQEGMLEGENPFYLIPKEFVDLGEYKMYVFTRTDMDVAYQRAKAMTFIIEKGTESSDNPHIFIYEFERITGASRTDMMLPYSDKVYLDVTELAPRITESTLDMEWIWNDPQPT